VVFATFCAVAFPGEWRTSQYSNELEFDAMNIEFFVIKQRLD
jgi:hypothetical protein